MIITLVSFAWFFGLLISRVGLPPMVGFLVAGFAYNFAGLEAPEGLQTISDLGVTLLLFSIGLKLMSLTGSNSASKRVQSVS